MFYLIFTDFSHPNFWLLHCRQVHLFLENNEFTHVLVNDHNIPSVCAEFTKQLADDLKPGEMRDFVIGPEKWKVTIRKCHAA